MRSIAKTELYITYQIEQEKPAEIQGTVCPAIGNKAIFNTHQHTKYDIFFMLSLPKLFQIQK